MGRIVGKRTPESKEKLLDIVKMRIDGNTI